MAVAAMGIEKRYGHVSEAPLIGQEM